MKRCCLRLSAAAKAQQLPQQWHAQPTTHRSHSDEISFKLLLELSQVAKCTVVNGAFINTIFLYAPNPSSTLCAQSHTPLIKNIIKLQPPLHHIYTGKHIARHRWGHSQASDYCQIIQVATRENLLIYLINQKYMAWVGPAPIPLQTHTRPLDFKINWRASQTPLDSDIK